ncbi:MAG: AMP-binding protein, partial [Gammaproteobacteria bacterium]|nr:AMP-binding protein [Gammaproteobacteria bacterium]
MSKTTTNNGQTISADDILSVVQEVVEEVHSGFSAVESISIDSTFDKDLGLDSLSRVQLISRVESRFKLALPERTFAEADTPRDLLRAVLGASQPAAIKTISEIKSLKLSEILGIPAEAETLVDVLRWHAEKHPDRLHIQMYEDDTDGEQLTYSQLYSSAQQIAAGLQSKGVQPADPVAIMLPSSPHYFHCFFGILMAGGIPVPIYPPARPSQLEDHLRRHSQILINCGTQFLITVPEATRVARLLKAQVPSLKEIIPVEELYQPASKFNAYTLKTEDTAFIQYTSGSTGQPKGVVLSHANLLANIRAMG